MCQAPSAAALDTRLFPWGSTCCVTQEGMVQVQLYNEEDRRAQGTATVMVHFRLLRCRVDSLAKHSKALAARKHARACVYACVCVCVCVYVCVSLCVCVCVVCAFVAPLVSPLICLFVRPYVHAISICSFVPSSILLFVCSFILFIHLSIYACSLFICSFVC